jgi:sulfate/thiosulfate transport system ATP-binding protein
VRKELRRWLRRLHDEVHLTSVFVTHDQEEAMEVADRVVVMNQGRIEQQGTPDELYDRPATPFVLQFLSDVAPWTDEYGDGFVRPRDLAVQGEPGDGTVAAVLGQSLTVGSHTRLEFKRADGAGFIDVELPRAQAQALKARLGLEPGRTLHLKPERVTRFQG